MNIFDRILSVVSPYDCLGCSVEGSLLCLECIDARLPRQQIDICYECGKPSRNFKVCTKCATKNKPDHVWITAKYEGAAKDIVHRYKFEHARGGSKEIARLMVEDNPYFSDGPLVIPVPTAPQHIRERGFDHALLLAKEVARERRYTYAAALARRQNTQQHGTKRSDRLTQLKGVFRVRNEAAITGKHILLIDDITTTGATLNECTKMLKKAGAAKVDAAVFARTPEK